MLRKGGTSVLRCALQHLLQQPVQQHCVQVSQVLSLQAVRFKSKPSFPKYRNSQTRAERVAERTHRAIQQAKGASLQQAADAPVAASPAAEAETSSSALMAGTQQAEPANSSSTTSSSSSGSSWTPEWLRNIIGDTGRRRNRSPPASASPLTPVSATHSREASEKLLERQELQKKLQKESMDEQSDGWENLEQMKEWSLDDYVNSIKHHDPRSSEYETPPRPMTPMRGTKAWHASHSYDQMRVLHMRFRQHCNIISAMSPEDKLRVKLNPDITRDKEALEELWEKTGYQVDQLRDCFSNFHNTRRDFILMHAFRQEGGKLPPQDDYEALELQKKQLRHEDDQAQLKALLQNRDKARCTLKQVAALTPAGIMLKTCPQTKLPYQECCGRNYRVASKVKSKRRSQFAA